MNSAVELRQSTDLLAALAPIDLDEINAQAKLQRRTDRKYVIPADLLPELIAAMPRSARVLEIAGTRSCEYSSIYFDTPDLLTYRLAATKRRKRFKVRTRHYVDTGSCFLEVKLPGVRGQTIKHRTEIFPAQLSELSERNLAFVGATLSEYFIEPVFDVRSTMCVDYLRTTLLVPGGRVTIDTGLRWRSPDLRWNAPAASVSNSRIAIVETKTEKTATELDYWLWDRRFRPIRMSKYCVGLKMLDPTLSANKWQKVLRLLAAA